MRHPLHPALVHFPIACWSLATMADVAGGFVGAPAWKFSGVLVAIGTVAALPAMATGLVESMKVAEGSAAARTVQRHMGAVLVAWGCYAASGFLRWQHDAPVQPTAIAFALGAIGFVALGFAGWLGGELVYRHRVGMMPIDTDTMTPRSER